MTRKTTTLLATCLLISLLLLSSLTHAYPIPDTGQTESYTDTFGEDSDYLINPPSYTKLNANGNDLPDSATSWVMVRDNVTGLIWEVKTDDGSVHDKDNTYTWYDSNPETNGGNAGTSGDGNDTEDFLKALNDESFGGYKDWRLPAFKELCTIVDLGAHDPAINVAYFPNSGSKHCWSSSTVVDMNGHAWHIQSWDGGCNGFEKYNFYNVRAVRGSQSRVANHFVINGDGTVTDKSTGLMWQQAGAATQMTWEEAIAYGEGLTFAGYADWRLPSRKELRSILDYNLPEPMIDTAVFPNLFLSSYWSSSSYAEFTEDAWSIDLVSGWERYLSTKSDVGYAVAVRGGQNWLAEHLAITSPAQTSAWNEGSFMPIRWDSKGIDGNVKISLSRQGGKDGTFEIVAANTENDGIYDWPITTGHSFNCMLKIEPLNAPDKGSVEGLFTIAAPGMLSPTIEINEATAVTYNSAALSGTVNPNGASTVVSFEWGTDKDYGNEATAVQGPLSGIEIQNVTAELKMLAPEETYHCRIKATNSAGTAYSRNVMFTTPYMKIIRKAIIVAGSGPYETNALWGATEMCAHHAYRVLKHQGYEKENIYYLTSGTNTDVDGDRVSDVAGKATNANLEYAIKTWAVDADNLFIYLVGHGREGAFVMGEFEDLSATQLDQWLDELQQTLPEFAAVVYDACRSGSFLPHLTPAAEKTRVLVTSAGPDEEAIFRAEGDLSFGWNFFSHLFNGESFYDSYVHGKNCVEAAYGNAQNPRLEANGNGTSNEKEDRDIARSIKVGLEKVTAGEIPRIESVSPAQVLGEEETSAVIYAENVKGDDITQVFAVIKPPDYTPGSPDNPVMDLPTLPLVSVGNDRFEGTYTDFETSGLYHVTVFAKDRSGFLSLPVQTTVTKANTCLSVGADLSILVPCAEYKGQQYSFLLDFYPHPDGLGGFYWKMIKGTLTAGTGKDCISIGADLSMPLRCVSHNGTDYGFTLKFYPNCYDSSGLYWKMDGSTLEGK